MCRPCNCRQLKCLPCYISVNCMSCGRHNEVRETEVHLEMPLQTKSISQFVKEFDLPSILLDYRCPLCRRVGQTREMMMITVPAPFLVFHKVGAGDVHLDENLRIMSVSIRNIYVEYFFQVINYLAITSQMFLSQNISYEYFFRIFMLYIYPVHSHRIFNVNILF